MTTSTFDSLHYVYESAKSSTGYVISSKKIKGREDAVWCAPSMELAQQWVIQKGLVDTTPQVSYNKGTQIKETTDMNVFTNDAINNMSITDLAALQLRVATRINFLLQQQQAQQSVATTTQPIVNDQQPKASTLDVVEVAATQVEPEKSDYESPYSADVDGNIQEASQGATRSKDGKLVEATPKRRTIKKAKKESNVEAVAEKIEASLCAMTKPECKTFIMDNNLLIKLNMKCEAMNDAINAFRQGGVEAIPTEYLTAAGVKKYSKVEAKEKASAKKNSSSLKISKSRK